jgi:hypothetical protein
MSNDDEHGISYTGADYTHAHSESRHPEICFAFLPLIPHFSLWNVHPKQDLLSADAEAVPVALRFWKSSPTMETASPVITNSPSALSAHLLACEMVFLTSFGV